jgi:2-methylcitrate dehydratase
MIWTQVPPEHTCREHHEVLGSQLYEHIVPLATIFRWKRQESAGRLMTLAEAPGTPASIATPTAKETTFNTELTRMLVPILIEAQTLPCWQIRTSHDRGNRLRAAAGLPDTGGQQGPRRSMLAARRAGAFRGGALSGSQKSAIERLAASVLAVRPENFSQRAVEAAKLVLLDTLGCGLAAFDDECAGAVLATLDGLGDKPQCTVLGHPHRMSAPGAVLANGTLIRVLDLNDYVAGAHPRSGARGGHPSDNIPVALAAAEIARAGGRDLLAAILIGYEIYGRGKALMDPESAWDGITISGLAAPAMAGKLMRLDAQHLAHAIALGAARAPTPIAVREGGISAAKSIANALIAQNGMQAALLAAGGVTGPLDLFEAERGLNAVFAHKPEAAGDILGAPMPADNFISRVAIKAYPCFAGGQSAVAAALALHGLVEGDIARLTAIRAVFADLPMVRRQLADPGRVAPRSREAADHSLHFLIAVALIDGTFGLAQFAGERWNDARVRAVMARLELTTDSDLARRAGESYPCALHAADRDGRRYDVEILAPPGFSPNGPDAKSVLEKFTRMTADRLAPDARDRIVELVMNLDAAASSETLMQALRPRPGAATRLQ